ncbi:hypothetical protein FQN49_008185, partial [Arthroderma sp. PD_2]
MASILDLLMTSEPGTGPVLDSSQRSDPPPTSSRLPLPSESNAPMSEAPEFADDQLVGPGSRSSRRPRHPTYGQGPPVVRDVAGEKVQQAFEELLETHIEDPMSSGAPPTSSEMLSDKYYISQIHGMQKLRLSTLYVDFTHLTSLTNQVLADAIVNQYYRFQPYLTKALHNLIAKYEPQYFRAHKQLGSHSSQAGTSTVALDSTEPTDTLAGKTRYQQTDKVFTLAFYNLPLVSRLRQLRTAQIGMLSSISGTVTRTSEVRPELAMGTFICESCNTVCPDIEQSFKFTEPTQCINATCGNRV